MTYREKKISLAIILALFIFVSLIGIDMYRNSKKLDEVIKENKIAVENSWKITTKELQIIEGSVEAEQIPTIGSSTIKFKVTLNPGEKYEYTYKILNEGTINAKIDSIILSDVPENINYTVEYEDTTPIAKNHLLKKNESETIKVKIEYIQTDTTIDPITLDLFNIITYVSDDGNGYDRKNLNQEKYITEESFSDEGFNQSNFGSYVISAVFALTLLAIAVIAIFLLKTEADD